MFRTEVWVNQRAKHLISLSSVIVAQEQWALNTATRGSTRGPPNKPFWHKGFLISSYLISKLNKILDLLFYLCDKFQVFSKREEEQNIFIVWPWEPTAQARLSNYSSAIYKWSVIIIMLMWSNRQTWHPLWGCRCIQKYSGRWRGQKMSLSATPQPNACFSLK